MTIIAEQEFAGLPSAAPAARAFVAALVTDAGLRPGAVLAVDELAANAIRHSRSGLPGGTFTVCVEVAAAWVRVQVTDQGGGGTPLVRQVSGDAVGGRGLWIVGALAAEWGVASLSDGLRVWVRFGDTPTSREQAAPPWRCSDVAVTP